MPSFTLFFFNASDGILPILYYNSGNDRGVDIYVTHDGGMHWQSTTPLSSNVYASSTIEQTVETIDFIDANHGWIVDANGTTLYATTDGGQHYIQRQLRLDRYRLGSRFQ